MMKKTKIGAAVMMAAFAMMTVQPMTSMAAGNCQTRICGGSSANLYGTVLGSCGVGNSNFGNCGSQIFGQSGCQTSGNCFGQMLATARQEITANQASSRIMDLAEAA